MDELDKRIQKMQGSGKEIGVSGGSTQPSSTTSSPPPTQGRYGTDQLAANKIIKRKRGDYSDH